MNLSINFGETRNVGNQLISKSEELSNAIKSINNANSQIADSWVGADASKYIQAVNMQAQYINLLATTVAEIGNYLIKVSNSYETASQNNASAVRF